jgi:hypothetical protein
MFTFSNTYASINVPTTSQISTYNRLLQQKNVTIGQDVNGNKIPDPARLTKQEMTMWIGTLQTIIPVRPITFNQQTLIAENCSKLGIKCPPIDKWTSEQASKFIQKLFDMVKEARLKEPASERQTQMIANFFDMELIDKMPTNLTRHDASEIIESIMPAYNAWLAEHASISQIITIQSLQRRLGDVVTENAILRKLSRDAASQMIEEFNKELENQHTIINGITKYNITHDDHSRDKDAEDKNKFSFDGIDDTQKEEAYQKICVLIGQQPDAVTTENVSKLLEDAISFTVEYGYADAETIQNILDATGADSEAKKTVSSKGKKK